MVLKGWTADFTKEDLHGMELTDVPYYHGVYNNLHMPAVITGGIFVLVALVLSLLLILQHLRSYTNPDVSPLTYWVNFLQKSVFMQCFMKTLRFLLNWLVGEKENKGFGDNPTISLQHASFFFLLMDLSIYWFYLKEQL